MGLPGLEPGTFAVSMGNAINLLRKFNVPCRGNVIASSRERSFASQITRLQAQYQLVEYCIL